MQDLPEIDFSKIQFPSEPIQKNRFALSDQAQCDLKRVMDLERFVVIHIFEIAAGDVTDNDKAVRNCEKGKSQLVSAYQQIGLSPGPHHAEQLIRDLEAMVLAQTHAQRGAGK